MEHGSYVAAYYVVENKINELSAQITEERKKLAEIKEERSKTIEARYGIPYGSKVEVSYNFVDWKTREHIVSTLVGFYHGFKANPYSFEKFDLVLAKPKKDGTESKFYYTYGSTVSEDRIVSIKKLEEPAKP